MKKFLIVILGIVFLMTYSAITLFLYSKFSSGEQVTTTIKNKKTRQETSKIGRSMESIGASTCIEKVEKLSKFIRFQKNSNAIIFRNKTSEYQGFISLLYFLKDTNRDTIVISDFAYFPDVTCEGTYEAIANWAESCDKVRKLRFPSMKLADQIQGGYRLLISEENVYVVLVSTKDGCVSIKKENIE